MFLWCATFVPAVADRKAEAEDVDASVWSMPPNSVQSLMFKTHFFEVIEELRMRRVCRTDSEQDMLEDFGF